MWKSKILRGWNRPKSKLVSGKTGFFPVKTGFFRIFLRKWSKTSKKFILCGKFLEIPVFQTILPLTTPQLFFRPLEGGGWKPSSNPPLNQTLPPPQTHVCSRPAYPSNPWEKHVFKLFRFVSVTISLSLYRFRETKFWSIIINEIRKFPICTFVLVSYYNLENTSCFLTKS